MRKIQCETCAVRSRCLVSDLPAQALQDFRAATASAVYKPRQVVFTEGSPATGLYLLCHGAVKLYHSDRFGHDHILEVTGPGAVLGELPADPEQRLSVSAETLSESQLCFLPRERLPAFLRDYPKSGMHLIAALSGELAAARRKVRDLALKSAEGRLAGLLVELARGSTPTSPANGTRVRYKRRELAEMVGVSTETAIRLLSKLKHKRAITTAGRDIVIHDFQKLRQLAHYDDTEM